MDFVCVIYAFCEVRLLSIILYLVFGRFLLCMCFFIRVAAFSASGATIVHRNSIKGKRSYNIEINFIVETVQMTSSKTNFDVMGFPC